MRPRAARICAGTLGLAAVLAAPFPSSAEPLLINQIAVAPSRPEVLYAAGRPVGILKSTDRGMTWTPAREGMLNTSAYHVVVHPDDADIAYVGTFGGGVYRTSNGGRLWEPVNTGLGNTNIHALSLDPKRPQRLVVSTSTGDVFETRDEGRTWTVYGDGLPVMDGEVLAAFLPRAGDLWLGQGTLFARAPDDAAWRTIGQDLSEAAITVLAANSDGRLYAGTRRRGLLSSTDAGQTWTTVGPEFERQWIRLVIPGPSGRVITSVLRRGLFRSDDKGQTWTKIGSGLADRDDVETLVADPKDPDRLYAGMHDHGLFLSRNGGLRFEAPQHVAQEPVVDIIASLVNRPVPGRKRPAAPVPPPAFQKCSGCHGWADPALSRKPTYWRVAANQRDWSGTVARMAPGAGLTPEERRQVTDFLTRYTAPTP